MSDNKKVHKMKLQPNPFHLTRSGSKKIETRLHDEKRKQIQVGDLIEFTLDGTEDVITVVVVGLHPESSFEKLFEKFPAVQLGGKDVSDLMGIYKYYSKEDEEKYGVLGIEISHENTHS